MALVLNSKIKLHGGNLEAKSISPWCFLCGIPPFLGVIPYRLRFLFFKKPKNENIGLKPKKYL